MPTLFADSWYYIALLDRGNTDHDRVVAFLKGRRARIVTTAWVLTEVAAHFSRSQSRRLFVQLVDLLAEDTETTVLPLDHTLYELGIEMYRNRPDKDWSLVDCISFVVMGRQALTDALTGDHHFEQAGFLPVFA
jgi:predicted nucleic acid-binding protein